MPFAQCIIGAPGAGKSTFCHAMAQFMHQHQPGRKVKIINLDLANDNILYKCDFDACSLVNYPQLMAESQLGPNGALVKATELLLESHYEDLVKGISNLEGWKDSYFLFDLPGQVELFTNYSLFSQLISKLESDLEFRFALVNLTDCTVCLDATKYISSLVLTVKTMLNFDCIPCVNLFSKFDLLPLEQLAMPIEFYLQANDLQTHLPHLLEAQTNPKFGKLNGLLCELVEDFGIVGFVPVAAEDAQCMAFVLREIDRANGFAYASLAFNDSILQVHCAVGLEEDYLELLKDRYSVNKD